MQQFTQCFQSAHLLISNLHITSLNFRRKTAIQKCEAHGFQFLHGPAFHSTFSIVMNDISGLFGLNWIVIANFAQGIDDVLERIEIIVIKNKIVQGNNFFLNENFG